MRPESQPDPSRRVRYASPGASCVASFTGSSRCLYGWRCVAGARRTLRSSSYGTSSALLHRRNNRPQLADEDRALLGAVAAALRPQRAGWLVTPETLLGWHRRRISRHWTQPCRAPGRPSTAASLRRLIIDMANDNPTWGYRRITGELAGLGHRVGASTVWRILKHHGLDPAPQRTSVTWTQFLRSQDGGCLRLRDRRHRPIAPLLAVVLHRHHQPRSPLRRNHRKPDGRPGPPKPLATSSWPIPASSATPEHFCETAPASSPATSTRSSEAKVSRFSPHLYAPPWRTRSPNAGSAPFDANSSTAPSSGTVANSTILSSTTSITTTDILIVVERFGEAVLDVGIELDVP